MPRWSGWPLASLAAVLARLRARGVHDMPQYWPVTDLHHWFWNIFRIPNPQPQSPAEENDRHKLFSPVLKTLESRLKQPARLSRLIKRASATRSQGRSCGTPSDLAVEYQAAKLVKP